MSDRVSSLALTLFLFAVMGAMSWMALDFNEQARRVPLVVGVPTTLALGVQLVREFLASRLGPEISDTPTAERAEEHELPDGEVAEKVPEGEARSTTKTERTEIPEPKASARAAFAWVLALGVSFYLIGMLWTVPVFVATFMRIYGRESWKMIVGTVVGTMGVLHVFFVMLLEVRLYQGVVVDWLGL